jgi:hypothetical protein
MKTFTLIAAILFLSVAGFAQTRHVTDNLPLSNPQLCPQPASPDGVLLNSAPLQPGQKMLSFTTIGNTWYDTQTYNAGNLMTRVYEHPDGTIGATWMHQAASIPPDRGSAYNYFDGAAWDAQTPHLGSDARNGHPCYAPWGPNGEIIAHYQYILNESPIKLLRRETKGEGPWLESILYPPDGNYSLVWHSMITSGPNHEYIHILAYVYDDPYQGQDDALLYYRSSDGGVTWDINGVIIEGLGSSYFPTVSSLRYSWAQPVGNTIAFAYGFDHFDGLVFKSTDNGDTWEKIKVYESPYDPFDLPDISEDFGCGDGPSAIALDSQGKVHVAFGRMVQFYDVVSTPPGGWYFYPVTEGMIYWNESMPMLDSTAISTYTLDNLIAGGNLVGWVVPDTGTIVIPTDQPNYGVGLTTSPQLAIDADDNIFLSWAAVAPEYSNGQFFFRHIFSNASFDGGATWTGIKDMTGDFIFFMSECVYPAIAPIVDQKVHLVFQEDFTPGTGSGEENLIDYIDFPIDFFVGTGGEKSAPGFGVSQNFPNPASGTAAFYVNLPKAGHVLVGLSNLQGQVLRQQDLGQLVQGNHRITLDLSDLAEGIYFYTVTVDGVAVSKKVMVSGSR